MQRLFDLWDNLKVIPIPPLYRKANKSKAKKLSIFYMITYLISCEDRNIMNLPVSKQGFFQFFYCMINPELGSWLQINDNTEQ